MALGAAMFVTVPQSYADDHAKCQRQIERAESKLDQAIRKHGERSHQAEQRRQDLRAQRERCWNGTTAGGTVTRGVGTTITTGTATTIGTIITKTASRFNTLGTGFQRAPFFFRQERPHVATVGILVVQDDTKQ